MIWRGGGFLSLGILVLFMKDDALKLLAQSADFSLIGRVLQALQTEMQSPL